MIFLKEALPAPLSPPTISFSARSWDLGLIEALEHTHGTSAGLANPVTLAHAANLLPF